MGLYSKMEERTSDGRIDLQVETDRYIYILSSRSTLHHKQAIDRIEPKKYWLPFQLSGKQIILIGANFDSKTRKLDPPVKIELPA